MKYYSLNEDSSLVEYRLRGNELAAKYMKIAKWVVFFISQFPFVRSVLISGSLSKEFMNPESDIDFFIITAPNRLWIARLFFVLTQKIIFLNSHKYLCFNYMIDTDHLELKEKNLFIAIEATTTIPMYGVKYYEQFLKENEWTKAFFPNFPRRETHNVSNRETWLKKGLEFLFNNRFGEWLDVWLMAKTEKRWQKRHNIKMKDMTGTGLFLKRYTAKSHTGGNYSKIMTKYDQKILEFEEKIKLIYQA
jgi:hypothetical protein